MKAKCISGVAAKFQPVTIESRTGQGSFRLNAAFVSNSNRLKEKKR
jgi:hypothetical protein